jgi:hypothetical protein
VYGHEGAFVEFADPNYTLQSSVTLSNIKEAWLPGRGIQLQTHADAAAGLGMLRGNRYPCIGGGVTLRGGPANCDASTNLTTSVPIDGLDVSGLTFHVDASTSQIPLTCSISLGSLGDLQIDQMLPATSASTQGAFAVPFSGSGSLVIPLPSGNVTRKLSIQSAVSSPHSYRFGRASRFRPSDCLALGPRPLS